MLRSFERILPNGHRLMPNMSLELTPTVRALHCITTSVGIWSSIESFWERSSAPSR